MRTNTIEGNDWLVSCLDPFHDYQQQIRGFPDVNGSISCVQLTTKSLSLSSPEASPASPWDAMIIFTGLDGIEDGSRSSGAFGNAILDSAPTFANYDHGTQTGTISDSVMRLAPMIVLSKVASGGTETVLSLTNDANTKRLSMASRSSPGVGRMIAVGFEVTNTTAEIYRQGSLCVAQCLPPFNHPSPCVVNYKDLNASPYVTAAVASTMLQELPDRVSSVKRVPGSGTWEASKGVYCVPRLTSFSLPITGGWQNSAVQYRSVAGPQGTLHSLPAQYMASQPMFSGLDRSAFAPVCVSLTGLSPQSTFNITLRTVTEFFPNEANTALLPFSFQSPSYDPRALETYADIVRTAPYAVPVGMNAAGDYFRMIMKAANKAGALASHLPGTLGMVGSGVKLLTSRWGDQEEPSQPADLTYAAWQGPPPGTAKRTTRLVVKKKKAGIKIPKYAAGPAANPTRR